VQGTFRRVVGVVAVGVALMAGLTAQGPSITLPGAVLMAGPDYATDVLQDPWDFSNAEDIAPDPDQFGGWVQPSSATQRLQGTAASFLSNGWFRGVAEGDTGLTLLYRADYYSLNPGRSGARHPIDTSRYRKLAVKMTVTGAPSPSGFHTYWFHSSISESNWTSRFGGAQAAPVVPAGSSTQLYVVDLAQAAAHSGAPFNAEPLVKGLRLDPIEGPGSKLVEIDWVRLTMSNGATGSAMTTAALSGCVGFQHLVVTDHAGTATIVSDSTGSDAARSFNYGIFPPGAYDVYAACGNGSTNRFAFQINSPPAVTILDPDEAGDPATDWASLAKNDPWDFEQLSDIAVAGNVSTTAGACAGQPCGIVPTERPGTAGNMLRASSVGGTPSQFGDPAIDLLGGLLLPLNTRRHHLLTFSSRVYRPYVLNSTVGHVLRVFWGSGATPDGRSMTMSQDMRVWPGMQTYTLDLTTLTTPTGIEFECPTCPTIPWVTRGIRHFRIDPHEIGDVPSGFAFDDITLTAPDEVALGQAFTVRYAVADTDSAGSTYTARIYRSSWPDRTGRTHLATQSVAPGQHAYVFNPQASSVPPGRYTISVELDESRSGVGFPKTSVAYASGQLVVVDPAASTPRLSVDYPATGQAVPQSFTIQGCAFDDGMNTGSINMDEIAVNAIAGAGVVGQPEGRVLPLGFGAPRGTIEFAPLGTNVICNSVTNPASPYRNGGFRIANVGLETGPWTLRVYARSTISGEYSQLGDIPILVGNVIPGPVNFQASAVGNTVTVSWEAPATALSYYQIQVATDPNFAAIIARVDVPAAGTYSGQLASGRYYLRVYGRTASNQWSLPTPTRVVDVALPGPPGAPTLVATQVASNPVSLNWAATAGGAPASYTLYAGTGPGASNLAVASMGLATSITAVAPIGVPIYVRVVASNAAGSAPSNEIVFTLAPPNPPIMNAPVVAGSNVTLSWTPPGSGGAPASYTVVARFEGSPTVIATLPVAGTSISVPAPPGRYVVTAVSHNGLGTSGESNAVVVVVP